jgi:putative transcriptional regulator
VAGSEKEAMSEDAFDQIMTGLNEALAHTRGDEVPGLRLHVPEAIDVVAIRKRTGLSQIAFSARIGVAVSTLRNWEQGRRTPEGPARVLLAMLDRNPRVVEQTLGVAT